MMHLPRKMKKVLLITSLIVLIVGIKILYNAITDSPVILLPSDVSVRDYEKRSLEYCNPLHHINSGQEGEFDDEYSLELVHVLIRHGARTSMHNLPGVHVPPISCQAVDKHLNISEVLRKVKDTWKRKYRVFGFDGWDMYPNKTLCKGSELTPFGMQQHIQTGQYLRHKYGKSIDLTQSHIRSTSVARTYQSAVAVLLGMLPHTDLENARIYKSGQSSLCSPSLFRQSCECPGADHLLNLATRKSGRNERQDGNIKRKVLENEFGDKFLAHYILDVFMTYSCHNISLPCIHSTKCINHSQLDLAWAVQDEIEKNMVLKNEFYIKYAHLYVHPLLSEIKDRMLNLTKRRRVEPFVLYSGHDITVTPLATVFGIHNGKWPPFASRIVIELHKKVDLKINYFIKVIYNGKDVTPVLSFCKNKLFNEFCKLKYFVEFVNNHLQDIGFKSYEHGCQKKIVELRNNSRRLWFIIVLPRGDHLCRIILSRAIARDKITT